MARPAFTKEEQELANQLFATVTGLLDDASIIAIDGQSHRRSQEQLCRQVQLLLTALDQISAVARAIEVIACRNSRHQHRKT